MVVLNNIQGDVKKILRLIHRKFGIEAADLPQAMAKIGRRLPKRLHKNAAYLHGTLQQEGHPKLAVQIDDGATRKAVDALVTALDAYDPKDARKGAILGALGSLAFNLILTVTLLVCFLMWRGFL